jgi:hypothetical protein
MEVPDQPLLDLDQLLEVLDHHHTITNANMKAVTVPELVLEELVGQELVEQQDRLQVPVPLHHQHTEV